MTIAEDIAALALADEMQAAAGSAPAFSAAVVLLKVWARRRGIAEPLAGAPLAAAVAALLRSGALAAAMSPLQMLRGALAAFGERKTWDSGAQFQMSPSLSRSARAPLMHQHVALGARSVMYKQHTHARIL